jgi:hypothetical protein
MDDYERLRKVVYRSCIVALGVEFFYVVFIYAGVKMRSLGTFNSNHPPRTAVWSLGRRARTC